MRRRGVSTADLAALAGIHPMTICRIRNGRQAPHPVTAALIAEALQSTPEDLGLVREEGGVA